MDSFGSSLRRDISIVAPTGTLMFGPGNWILMARTYESDGSWWIYQLIFVLPLHWLLSLCDLYGHLRRQYSRIRSLDFLLRISNSNNICTIIVFCAIMWQPVSILKALLGLRFSSVGYELFVRNPTFSISSRSSFHVSGKSLLIQKFNREKVTQFIHFLGLN